ncbi:glycosyltransferase family 4 protein [Elongatibacter sediminis]|uniref:Glycosyltransferase family 4 protein n=1 Tax=Elongatibacter sediminis TaxID=3119006 RepID=A0AAW9R957_9GAMM
MSEPLRVTFCAYDFPNYVGGPNAWLLRLLPQLGSLGIDCSVLFLTLDAENSPTAEALLKSGIPSKAFPFTQTTRKKIQWILGCVAENPPHVFVPNLVIPAYFAAGWVRAAGIPTVGILHSDDSFYHAIVDEFSSKEDFFRVSSLVCVSEYLMQSVRDKASPKTSVHYVPYGVPVPPETASQPDEDLKVIYVGRLEEEQKRISEVTRAFCEMVRQVPGTCAKIYGDGPAKTSIAKILQEEDKLGRVEIMGRVPSDEIQSHISQNHVVVLLSDYEGLPIALLEAMACGLVPVCLNISSGIPQLVKNGETGLLVSDRGKSFVSAIKSIKASRETWQSLSQSARNMIIESYSDKACADHWEAILRKLADECSSTTIVDLHASKKLPLVRREFVREDFRGHHLLFRGLNKVDRVLRKLANHLR